MLKTLMCAISNRVKRRNVGIDRKEKAFSILVAVAALTSPLNRDAADATGNPLSRGEADGH